MGSDAVGRADGRAVRALLPEPALVPRRPRARRGDGQELPGQPDQRPRASTSRSPARPTTRSRPTSVSPSTPAPARRGSWATATRSRPSSSSAATPAPPPPPPASASRSRPPRPAPLPRPPPRRLCPLAALVRRRPRARLAGRDRRRVPRPGPRDARPSLVRPPARPLARPPSMTAAAQLRRILHLIPHLGDGEPHPIAEIVERAGVDRDAAAAATSEPSATATTRPAGSSRASRSSSRPTPSRCVTNHFLRPMRLTRAELLRAGAGAGDAARRAAGRGAPGDRPRPRAAAQAIAGARRRARRTYRVASLAPAGDPEHLRRLRDAHRTRRRVRLTYRKAGRQAASSRMLCPYGIVFASGMWYVVANCGDEGLRFFRLDRVEDVEVLEERYERPEGLLARGGDAGRPRVPGPGRRHAPGALLAQRRALDRGAGREAARRRTARSRSTTRWPTPTGPCATCCSTAPTPRCWSRRRCGRRSCGA